MSERTATDVEFWNAIAELEGARFRHHGRVPPNGPRQARLDCVGPFFVAHWKLGLPCDDFTEYGAQPDSQVLLRLVHDRCVPRPWAEYVGFPGRLVLLGLTNPQHVAFSGPDGLAVEIAASWKVRELKHTEVHSVWLPKGIVATRSAPA